MQRETKEVTTISGKKVVVQAYLTAREMQEINTSIIGDQRTDVTEGAKLSLPVTAGIAWEKKILEKALVSIDGDTNTPVEKILDFSNEEYNDLKAKIWEALKINLKQAK